VFYDYTRSHHITNDIDSGCYNKGVSTDNSLKLDIYAALATLKLDERTCITLQLIDGYKIDQISKITGMPSGTVKSHLQRGKEKMADYLKKNGYDR
jgi:RNA polymerase sigma-70 factor (ECF subfamily)